MHLKRQIFIKMLSLCLCVPLFFSGCSLWNKSTDTTDLNHEFVYADGIHSYGYIDIGSCKKLIGKVYTLVIFINDSMSSWDEAAQNNFYDKRYFPSINYLSKQAEKRDIELNIQNGKYTTKSDRKTPIRYNGKIASSAENASLSLDLLNYTAKALGFTDAEYMNTILKKNLEVEQIAYVIALNKPGRAYAIYDNSYDGKDEMEFVVAFSQNENGKDNIGSSVLHELLHLFGATDLYDGSGIYKKRFELCQQLFPNDIMMRSAVNPESLEIGSLTECLIGWSESFPSVCDCPEWFEKNE